MDPKKLAGISKSFSEKTGSPLDPELEAFFKAQMGVFQPQGPQVAPPKPDPEAEANAQINRAVNPQRAALQQIARPPVPPVVAPQADPEELERQENERLMQMEYYARKAGLK